MVSIYLLASMLQKHLILLPRLLVLFRAAIVRAVWSSKMPLANAPVGVDPAFHIVWARFRVMRRYLSYCPEEEPRICRMLDLISWGAQGHGPVHLLLTSAAELGFAWDGDERGWVRVSLPPLRMLAGPIQHFQSDVLDAWRFQVFAKLSDRKGFWGCSFADFQGSLQLLTSSHLRERYEMLLRAILCGCVCGTDSFLARPRRKTFRVVSVGKRMVMVTCSGTVLFTHSACLGSS